VGDSPTTRAPFTCVCGCFGFTALMTYNPVDEAGVIYEPSSRSSDITCVQCGEVYNLARIAMGPEAYDARMAEIDRLIEEERGE
jgi:hypothetical protein